MTAERDYKSDQFLRDRRAHQSMAPQEPCSDTRKLSESRDSAVFTPVASRPGTANALPSNPRICPATCSPEGIVRDNMRLLGPFKHSARTDAHQSTQPQIGHTSQTERVRYTYQHVLAAAGVESNAVRTRVGSGPAQRRLGVTQRPRPYHAFGAACHVIWQRA